MLVVFRTVPLEGGGHFWHLHRKPLIIVNDFVQFCIPISVADRYVYPGSESKNISIFLIQKIIYKLSDPGCSSRTRILIFLPIPDPRSRGEKCTESRIPDPDPQH